MASLCLPNSELHVGVDWTSSGAVRRALSDPARPPMLLYPGEGAIDVLRHPPPGPITLVVVDGTWCNTKKMIRRNPQLAALPRLAFAPPCPSQYRLRREPHHSFVSTIEALAYVLGALERDASRFAGLVQPFRAMVDRQIACSIERRQGRMRRPRRKADRPHPVRSALLARAADLVCVVGEANAWPYRSAERAMHPDELVHWVACRLGSGEIFDCTALPSVPLSPSTPHQIGVSLARLETSAPLSELLVGWQGFLRETDVVCSWGRYATSLLVAAGGPLPASRIDMRELTRELTQRRVGTVEAFLRALGTATPPALASGRAGIRLGQLASVVRYWQTPE